MSTPTPALPLAVPEAVLERLATVVAPVYDGAVPLDGDGQPVAQRYAVLYADPGALSVEDLSGQALHLRCGFQVTSVGTSARQARWVAGRTRDALVGWRPVAQRLWCSPVEHLSTSPVRRDDDLSPPLFYVADTYVSHAVRTP